jgi:O-antigen/teichoic acid export membrane protein
MTGRTRTLRGNAGLVFGGDVASKAGLIVATLFAARALSIQEFAALAAALAAAGIMASVLDAGSALLITRDGAASADARVSLAIGLARARVPLACLILAGSAVVGALVGRPLEAVLAAGLALSSACAQTLSGIARAARDTRPEAESKLLGAVLAVAALSVLAVSSTAAALLAALWGASVVALWPLVRRAPLRRAERPVRPVRALRRAAPLGVLALATIVYFRSGTIALSLLSEPKATASFAVASSAAFGLLMLPNAVAAGLMPRLGAMSGSERQVELVRRALGWTFALTALLAFGLAGLAPFALPLLYGPGYEAATGPLTILAVAVVVVGVNTVLGTALLARGKTSLVVVQSAVSLTANIALLAVLGAAFGALGAALAMLGCELIGLALLAWWCRGELPGLLALPRVSVALDTAPHPERLS